ncbi:MAG: hypothetical protein K8R86_06460 [Bacteroidales bacterium]|nr:hypothetical protein [Bacteroidales bacterium]
MKGYLFLFCVILFSCTSQITSTITYKDNRTKIIVRESEKMEVLESFKIEPQYVKKLLTMFKDTVEDINYFKYSYGSSTSGMLNYKINDETLNNIYSQVSEQLNGIKENQMLYVQSNLKGKFGIFCADFMFMGGSFFDESIKSPVLVMRAYADGVMNISNKGYVPLAYIQVALEPDGKLIGWAFESGSGSAGFEKDK